LARRPEDGARGHHRRPAVLRIRGEISMQFLDDSLLPETQEKLVITVAPYGPEWEVADFPEDLPLTMDEHVQQAVDCYNPGGTALHIPVREREGRGSAHPRPRAGRERPQAPVQVQRATRPAAQGRT